MQLNLYSPPFFLRLSTGCKLVPDITRRNKSSRFRALIQKGCMGASDNIICWPRLTYYVSLGRRAFGSSTNRAKNWERGRFLRVLDQLLHFLTRGTLGCKKSYQLPAVRCIQPFYRPLLFSTTWINRGWEMGRRGKTRERRKGSLWYLFTSCSISFMSPQFTWPWWTLPNNCSPGERVKLALLLVIVVDLPQLMGNEAWAAEAM